MSTRRPIILMGFLLALLAVYVGFGLLNRSAQAPHTTPRTVETSVLPGKDSVSGLQVKQGPSGIWEAEFDYFFTGNPQYPALTIELTPQSSTELTPGEREHYQTILRQPVRGSHHVSAQIRYPGAERTVKVSVVMRKQMFSPEVVASQSVEQSIDWPDFGTWLADQQLADGTPAQIFNHAVALIDSEDAANLGQAKAILERMISENPKFDPGYVELARIAMKTNWGPEGLHQAEGLLISALQIRPDSVNAKILMGYVKAHERRYGEAEALFAAAANSNPSNLWLWSNWGELLAMEGKPDQAMSKYRQAIAHPATHDTNDHARQAAYEQLLDMLGARKDYDGMETLYKQRLAEFGPGSCYSADYGRFLLQIRGDTEGAIRLARGALNQRCDDAVSRELLGLAEYVKWASSTDSTRTDALNQARIYLPGGPKPLYLLASSARTLPTARALLAAGERIDQKGNDQLTALAYALQARDLGAAERLLALGARTDIGVGALDIPVAFVPVVTADVAGVRLMRRHGVDYGTLRYRGITALEMARRMGDRALLEALGQKATEL